MEEDRLILENLAEKHMRVRMAFFSVAMRVLPLICAHMENEKLSPADLLHLSHALRTCQVVAETAINGSPGK